MRELVYNGITMEENCVPGCKMSLCHEKAVAECERCGDPICNGHVSWATPGSICHSCRLDAWREAVKA